MRKINRFVSLEMVLAILLIAAFFLPWLDWGPMKKTGWEIPDFQKTIVKATNFVKFFSKNKEWEYTTYVVFAIPVLSAIVCLLWIWAKYKLARIILLVTGIVAFIVSLNLFYKLPKAGSGVYLLCVTAIVSVAYAIFALRRRKIHKDIADNQNIEA